MPRICLDLFAGTGSSTAAFAAAPDKWTVKTVEKDTSHKNIDLYADILDLRAEDIITLCGGTPDFIWASPPCTGFSVASLGRNWDLTNKVYTPKSNTARLGLRIVEHTLDLIRTLHPTYWVMENPRGMLRKQTIMQHIPRATVTYCQYGDFRMKPTDLFGKLPPNFVPLSCTNGSPCHQAAPRGSALGTTSIRSAKLRSRIPYQLSHALAVALENI